MDIGEIISESLRYPTSDWGKVLILGIIIIASILIVPIFLVYGYLFRIIKATLAGLNELPEFDELGEMFVDGIKVFVVGIVYAIPVIIIAAIVGHITGIGSSAGAVSLNAGFFWAEFLGNLVLIIVGIIIGLIEIIAIANMAYYDGDLGAAFKFSEILDHIARIGWGKYIATYVIICIIGFVGFLIGIATIIIIVGIVLLPLVIMPFIAMFGVRAIAQLIVDSLPEVSNNPETNE